MDSWGSGEGVMPQGAPPAAPQQRQAPPPPAARQVTPPQRPAQQVIRDDTDANRVVAGPVLDPQQQVQGTTEPAVPAAAPTPMLSEADLTRIATVAGAAARGAVPQQQVQQPQQPAMTDEQFNARYRVPVVTAQTMQAINDPDPVKGAAALNALLKQTYTSSLLMANDLHTAEIARVRAEVSPHVREFQAFQQQRQAQAQHTRFTSAHPDIAQETDLINDVRDTFEARINRGEMQRFPDEPTAFKAVADNVRKLVARMNGANPSVDGGQPSQVSQAPAAPVQRRPAVATQQGRGSSGQPQQGAGALDKMMESWNNT